MADLRPDSNVVGRLRAALGLSQEKFASELGMSTASVRAFEGGQKLSESAVEKLKTLAARHMLPDIAIDLDSKPFAVRDVFGPGKRVRLPKHPAGKDLGDMLHAMVDRVLESGHVESIAAVEAVLQLALNAVESVNSASKSGRSGSK